MGIFRKSEEDIQAATVEELQEMIDSANLPSRARQVADKELAMLSKISPSTAEYTIGLTYIDYLLGLPWNKKTKDNLDLQMAGKILDERHYGLQQIKERILEHLAVKILVNHKKPRILVVDDEKIALENLEPVLKKEGYAVSTADSGAGALRKIDTNDFDVVITDLKMKGINGIDVLEKARSKCPDTQVIMFTGYATIDSAVEAIKKGAFNYITKPLKLDNVRAVVKEALEKKYYRRASGGSLLCFAGPPGTGKTSLGRAVADALGRKFARISLGGIKDEAEIMGHRRTYAGAMPGRIIDEIYRSGVSNPLLMLDELDKIPQDFKGDPSSALLEALDPEQNHEFIDHYIDMPFDLSGVMFIATANIADNIQDALRDRLEVIEFSGYTEDEKKEIALRYLVPKQINEKGLSDSPPEFSAKAVTKIIQEHTREAGIRNLERQIAAVCRKIASGYVHNEETDKTIRVTPELIERYLGPRKYYFEVADEKNRIGVTTGLVWTETGGAIIFVEAAKMKGSGELILTGSLGDVMRESAQAALSYIRSNAASLNIAEDFFETQDIHVHVPAGAIPKDGPSAGTTIAIALISLLTGRPAKREVAISGEMTLSGRILPVGGIKEKLLAARQAGVKVIVMPIKNKVDLESLPRDVKTGLEVIHVDNVDEIIDLVLMKQ
ncbi:MAG TPA: endopeptidase La [Nitrospirae bacterium]|nr:lon protease [bacterium BMS3Abin06]HDH13499.1 endopeptidase La [Nitrospirota bacterium]HDZ01061.1 endopeptidase La [Nitrospirota bacterium]